jgi:hypothetical protein
MSFVETLKKIRSFKAEKVDVRNLAEEEAFSRFIAQPYYLIFIKNLESIALTEGIGLTDGTALLKSVGKREAILEIIADLKRKERILRERLQDESDDEPED